MFAVLKYERGTIRIDGDVHIPHAKWDDRSKCYRALAYKYRDIIDYLNSSKIEYDDHVMDEIIPAPVFDVNLELRDYQAQAVERWMIDKKGVIVLPTGAGKTYIALEIIKELSVSTLVIVPTLALLEQWKEKLSIFGEEFVGEFSGRRKELKPITVTTYDSAYINAEILGNKFMLLIADECFTYDTQILTEIGWLPIGHIVENRLNLRVLTHRNRFMPIIGWHRVSPRGKLVDLTFEDGTRIRCTGDHMFLTDKGWVKAVDLKDYVYRIEEDKRTFEECRIDDIKCVDKRCGFVYDLTVMGDHSYIANGIVVHNCHHLPAESYRLIAEMSVAPYRLGLTAVYKREDGLHSLLPDLIGGIVYELKPDDLAGKYLANYVIRRMLIPLTDEEREEYKRKSEKFKQYIISRGIKLTDVEDFRKIVMMTGLDSEAYEALKSWENARKIAFNSKNKIKTLKELLEKHRGDKIIIFTRYNDLVYTISKIFFIPAITHKTDKKERNMILSGFKKGKFKAIVSSQVLDEGIDVPDANVGIIVSGTGSSREFIQRLGRILRPAEGKDKAILYELISKETGEVRVSRRRRSM